MNIRGRKNYTCVQLRIPVESLWAPSRWLCHTYNLFVLPTYYAARCFSLSVFSVYLPLPMSLRCRDIITSTVAALSLALVPLRRSAAVSFANTTYPYRCQQSFRVWPSASTAPLHVGLVALPLPLLLVSSASSRVSFCSLFCENLSSDLDNAESVSPAFLCSYASGSSWPFTRGGGYNGDPSVGLKFGYSVYVLDLPDNYMALCWDRVGNKEKNFIFLNPINMCLIDTHIQQRDSNNTPALAPIIYVGNHMHS